MKKISTEGRSSGITNLFGIKFDFKKLKSATADGQKDIGGSKNSAGGASFRHWAVGLSDMILQWLIFPMA